VRNPYTGAVDYSFSPPTAAELRATATTLRAAQPAWAALPLAARIDALQRFGSAVREAAGPLEDALFADTGRRRISRMEVDGVGNAIQRWCALAPAVLAEDGGRSAMVPSVSYGSQQLPFALVGVISPWNFPLSLSTIDALPALLAGSAVLIKPSEITPRFVAPLRQALARVPELQAVLALLPGDGQTGAELIDAVDLVCFTGSVATGRRVGQACAARFIPCFLELGGKDPAIVLPGADLGRAATALLRGAVINTGQACQSIERIYVHHSIAGEIVERLVALAEAVTINWPDPARGMLGPIISRAQSGILQRQLDDARQQGAHIHCGGSIEDHGGLWLRPTVLSRVHHGMQVMTEETFGPLLPVMAFASTEEAVRLANDSEFGLSGCVFAATDDEAEAVGRALQVGGVSLNDASLTSLVYEAEKHAFNFSGLGGSRMGPAGMRRFLRKKALLRNAAAPFPIGAFAEG
jgi:acyl-CoA reductase-like NAD-dependent aldehyde dehydrogenase